MAKGTTNETHDQTVSRCSLHPASFTRRSNLGVGGCQGARDTWPFQCLVPSGLQSRRVVELIQLRHFLICHDAPLARRDGGGESYTH